MKDITPHISKITIGRLHNLGNYEHVRYEITVDMPPGGMSGTVIAELETLLDDLDPKPPVSSHELSQAKAALAKPYGEMSDWERRQLETYTERVKQAEDYDLKRRHLVTRFDALGGTAKRTDAKETWEDDEPL